MGWDIRTGPELHSVEEAEAFAATLPDGDPRSDVRLEPLLVAFRKVADEVETRCEAWARAWCTRNGLDPERWGSYRLPWPADLRREHSAAVDAMYRASNPT